MQLAVVLFFLAICLVLIGIGMVVATVVIAGIAALVAMGVVSSSVLVGVTRKDPGSGVRIFVLQSAAILGGAVGAGLAVLAKIFVELPLGKYQALSAGVAAGLTGGFLIGLLLNFTWGRTVRYLQQLQTKRL